VGEVIETSKRDNIITALETTRNNIFTGDSKGTVKKWEMNDLS